MRKKIYYFLLICFSLILISCSNNSFINQNENDEDYIFNIAYPAQYKFDDMTYFPIFSYTTVTTPLYYKNPNSYGYTPGMAKKIPLDVTSEYIGEKWKITEGEKGRAWKIELRDDLSWENGEKITAQDFIDTIILKKSCYFEVTNWDLYNITAGKIDISDLGIKVEGNSLILIYTNSLTIDFLYDSLHIEKFELVNKEIYSNCYKKNEDGSIYTDEFGYTKNDYGSGIDKFLSYGPYKYVQFDENGVRLIKNENWFGYKDLNDKYYQTEEIVIDYLDDYSMSYDLLVDGKYDYISSAFFKYYDINIFNDIDEKYIKKYYRFSNSLVLYFNLNEDDLETSNAQILSILEFRKALILSLNLDKYITDVNDILKQNNLNYLYDNYPFFTSHMEYNKYTKEKFCETKEFEDVKECYEQLYTSSNKEYVKELFNTAYDIAIEKGYIKEDGKVSIAYGESRDPYNIQNLLIEQWKEAVKGTKFENKISFSYFQYSGLPNYLYQISLSYYSGNNWENSIEVVPYLKQLHKIDDYNDRELSINFDKVIDVNNKEYINVTLSSTIGNWINGFRDNVVKTSIIIDGKIEEVDILYEDNAHITNKIMAECEKFVFNEYSVIPVYQEEVAVIISDKLNLNTMLDDSDGDIEFRYLTYN